MFKKLEDEGQTLSCKNTHLVKETGSTFEFYSANT